MSENDPWAPVDNYVSHLKFPDVARRRLGKFFAWAKKNPQEVLDMQKQASLSQDDVERYKVADLVKNFVESIEGQRNTKLTNYGVIRGFFLANYRPLPQIYQFTKKLANDRDRAISKVTPEMLHVILLAVRNDPRKRSMILTQLSTFAGVKELMLINQHYGYLIGEAIRKGKIPIELEMVWQRKTNTDAYRTYIGSFACEALKEYFEKERGWPKEGEPIWYGELSKKGEKKKGRKEEALTDLGYRQMWMRLTAKLGFRPSYYGRKSAPNTPKETWRRYGTGPHQLRDLSISLSQRAISEGFNPESAEYFAGHTIDPLGYRNLHGIDPNYRKAQYEIVEKFINPYQDTDEKIRELEQEHSRTIKQQTEQINMLTAEVRNLKLFMLKQRAAEELAMEPPDE